jgi:hypothetical protein
MCVESLMMAAKLCSHHCRLLGMQLLRVYSSCHTQSTLVFIPHTGIQIAIAQDLPSGDEGDFSGDGNLQKNIDGPHVRHCDWWTSVAPATTPTTHIYLP